jgi:hypothetical protein
VNSTSATKVIIHAIAEKQVYQPNLWFSPPPKKKVLEFPSEKTFLCFSRNFELAAQLRKGKSFKWVVGQMPSHWCQFNIDPRSHECRIRTTGKGRRLESGSFESIEKGVTAA